MVYWSKRIALRLFIYLLNYAIIVVGDDGYEKSRNAS